MLGLDPQMQLLALEHKVLVVFQKLLRDFQQPLHRLQVQWKPVELELPLFVVLLLQAVFVQLAMKLLLSLED